MDKQIIWKVALKGLRDFFFSDNIAYPLNLETSMKFLNIYKFLIKKIHDPNI